MEPACPAIATKRFRTLMLLIVGVAVLVLASQTNGEEQRANSPIYVGSDTNRVPPIPVLIQSINAAVRLTMERRLPADVASWQTRREEARLALRHVLGLDEFPERSPLSIERLGVTEVGTLRIEKLVFASRPGFLVTANLYYASINDGQKRPAILCPIGHFLSAGKTAHDVQQRCRQLADMGFIVMTYDPIGQGERMWSGNIHHEAGYALLPIGDTIAGWMVWDSMRAIDVLQSLPEVNATRIGITGNSGGGLNSLLTSALDERVQAAAVVGFTYDFAHWLQFGGTHCTCTHWPGVLPQLRWSEIAALTAPRAMMMIQGDRDAIFGAVGARRAAAETVSLFSLQGCADQVRFVELPNQPHAYSRPFREPMYGWMQHHLLDRPSSEPIAETTWEPLPEQDARLLCDPNQQRLPTSPTVVELARRQGNKLIESRSQRMPETDRASMREWLATMTRSPADGPHPTFPRIVQSSRQVDRVVETLHFFSEDGQRIPATYLRSLTSTPRQRVVVVVDERGREAFLEEFDLTPLIAAGWSLFAIDLRGRGESLGFYQPNWNSNFRLTATQVLAGQPLAGRRAYDIHRAIDYLASRDDVDLDQLSLISIGSEVIAGLLASATDTRIQRQVIARAPHSMVEWMRSAPTFPRDQMGDHWNDPQVLGVIRTEQGPVDFGAIVPGILQHADLSELMQWPNPRSTWFVESTTAPGDTESSAPLLKASDASHSAWLTYAPTAKFDITSLVNWLAR